MGWNWKSAGAPLAIAALLAASPGGPVGSSQGAARAASFNCAQAASPTELAICGDASLSALDGALGIAYAQRLALNPALRQLQRGWLKARDVGCGRDRGCLRKMMTAQLAWLRAGAVGPSSRVPTAEGACSLTAVSRIESRLEGAPDSGSAIEEANGAYQVSYDEIPAIQRSRSGDPVLLCLVSIPTDCPPHDNRGRVYAGANLRTLGAWSAPDAEHMCGGA
jgi:uncharacterized protein